MIANAATKGASAHEPERPLEIAAYDVVVPCRRFGVSYKLAVLGRVSLTTEFMLRLLKATGELEEKKAAAFFGFDHRDMAFVLDEAESLGYVEREDGRLHLTIAGMELFRGGSDSPEIYEIEQRRDSFVFDLFCLAPQRYEHLDEHEVHLPELKGLDPEQVSAASKSIPDAVRKYYFELIASKERNNSTSAKRSIYSIDDVRPGNRLLGLVRFSVRLNTSSVGVVEPDLSGWRSDQELEDRARIVNSVTQFVEDLKVARTGADADAYRALVEAAPEFLKEFTRTDGLAVDRYYREATTRVGNVRSDRPTVPLVGNITTGSNLERLRQVIRYARRRRIRPSSILWFKPRVKSWGATGATKRVVDVLARMIESVDTDTLPTQTTSICFAVGDPDYYLTKMFDRCASSNTFPFPQSLEILLVPGLLTALLVHAPVGSPFGFPIPLGLASFDGEVIKRVAELVKEKMFSYTTEDNLLHKVAEELDRDVPPLHEDVEPAEAH